MRRRYRRSRTDYPAGVLAVYDNGGRTADRYTVVYEPYRIGEEVIFQYVGMSHTPYHPQGFCQHGEDTIRPTTGWGSSMGKVIAFEDLPTNCQRVVRQDLEEG